MGKKVPVIYSTIQNENKPLLGKLIKFKRLSQQRTRKEFVFYLGTKICSVSTLVSMESGIAIKNDLFYHQLIHNLGYSHQEKKEFNNLLLIISRQLYDYIMTMDDTLLDELQRKINLLPSQDFLYGQLRFCY